MKKYFILIGLVLFVTVSMAKDYTVDSPGGRLKVKISVEDEIHYSVFLGNTEIISPSAFH